MSALGRRQRKTLEGLAAALLPGHTELPGADRAGVAEAIETRMASWAPRVRSAVRMLLIAWELSPLLSRHRRRFASLDPHLQVAWTEQCYRSRRAFRRLHVAALKQLVFLAWASTEQVEDALGYDYRCRRDDEPHGAARPILGQPSVAPPSRAPRNYHRDGPAVQSGAVPRDLVGQRTWHRASPPALTTIAHPEV
ncbi:MAG: gluconate 2-dehydrogenase subunit 3 family protein, partial [Gaiellales bacterium]